MATLSVARIPPALPPRRYQAKDRQGSCTHTHMIRIWEQDLSQQHYCHLCHRHQYQLYRCVQDHDGALPQSDFSSSLPNLQKYFEPDWEVTLSDWIVDAIDRGEYTPNQVQRLVEQKIGVKRAIIAQAQREHESPASSRSSDDSTESSTADYSTYSTLPTTLDEDLSTADRDMKHDGLLGTGTRIESAPRMSIQLNTCEMKCCHACRPTYRERTWLILDKVVNDPYIEPPSWELNNRPVSGARLLAKIGLAASEPRDPYADFSFMIDAAFRSDNLSTQLDDTKSRHAFTRQRAHSFRHKSDFEEAVRGVISLGAEDAGFANQYNRQASNSSHSTLPRASRSISDASNMEDSTHSSPSASQLSLAHTIKETGEVAVADGLAVREEGIDMGAADIITQA